MGSLRALPICAVLALASVAGCGNKPSKDQCSQLLEHVLDLEIKAGGASGGALTPEMKEDLENQRKAVLEANRDKYVSTCTSKTPKRVVECQIGAKDLDALAKCE